MAMRYANHVSRHQIFSASRGIQLYLLSLVRNTPCLREQTEFEEASTKGKSGRFMHKPNCDVDGNYMGYKCTPNGL